MSMFSLQFKGVNMNIIKERRVGNLKISWDIIKQDPSVVQKVLAEILVIEDENSLINGIVEYRGYSQHFDVVEPGQMIPDYVATVETDKDEYDQTVVKSIGFKRQHWTTYHDALMENWLNVRLIQKEN